VQVTNPDLQSGMASNAFTVTIPITYAYPITSTCNTPVTDCLSGTGAPDGDTADIDEGGVITLDFGIGNGIMDGQGYDFVFYEWVNPDPPPTGAVHLDFIAIELSEDLAMWYEVFNWGDGYNSPMDDSTNITAFSNDTDEEVDNEVITATFLYDWPNPPSSGILIDINFLPDPSNAQYRYVRLSCPGGGDNDSAQVDSIERLH
jgi:hypothetical protein